MCIVPMTHLVQLKENCKNNAVLLEQNNYNYYDWLINGYKISSWSIARIDEYM